MRGQTAGGFKRDGRLRGKPGSRLRRAAATALVSVFLVFTAVFSAWAGTWQQDKFGWWYQNDNGTYPTACWQQIDNTWYYFKESGYMATGPLNLDGVQYYLEDSGAMVADSWIEFRGDAYYFTADGSMAVSTWVDDVRYVDEDGRMVKDRWVGDVYIDEDGMGEHPDAHFFD